MPVYYIASEVNHKLLICFGLVLTLAVVPATLKSEMIGTEGNHFLLSSQDPKIVLLCSVKLLLLDTSFKNTELSNCFLYTCEMTAKVYAFGRFVI